MLISKKGGISAAPLLTHGNEGFFFRAAYRAVKWRPRITADLVIGGAA